MAATQQRATTMDETAAPWAAWDALAAGYDRYVAPQGPNWPTRHLPWWGSRPASGFSTSPREPGD